MVEGERIDGLQQVGGDDYYEEDGDGDDGGDGGEDGDEDRDIDGDEDGDGDVEAFYILGELTTIPTVL